MASNEVVGVHGDCLSPKNPALVAYPAAPAVFVWDEALLAEWEISLKRIMFIYECLLELPVSIRKGSVVEEVAAVAKAHGAQKIVTTATPSPRFEELRRDLEAEGFTVEVRAADPFVPDEEYDLKRFSRYWRTARKKAMEKG